MTRMQWLGQFGLLAWFATSPVLAQRTINIPPEPMCTACSVEFTRIARLGGDTEAEGLIAPTSKVVRDSEGVLYVAPTYARGLINKYSPSGAPAGVLGRLGSGPGEHARITNLAVGPHDSLYAFDQGNARFSVWAPAGDFARVGRIPRGPNDVIVLPDGRVVMQAWIPTPVHAGFPIHLLGRDGRVMRSFGSETGEFRIDDPFARFRALALGVNLSILSGRYNRYELELWSLDGRLQERYLREVPWFPPQNEAAPPPQPTLRALTYDEDGMLWVLINVPDPEWDEELPSDASSSAVAHRMFDTVIEIIDPGTGRLLTSHRHSKAFFQFIAPGLVPIFEEGEGGARYIDLWKIELAR
jgi:hypothetical protein